MFNNRPLKFKPVPNIMAQATLYEYQIKADKTRPLSESLAVKLVKNALNAFRPSMRKPQPTGQSASTIIKSIRKTTGQPVSTILKSTRKPTGQPASTIIKSVRKLAASMGILFTLFCGTQVAMANEQASDFTLKSKENGNIRLSEQRGNIVMVNFWASWCGPCREELPKMEALYQEYQDMGFEILAINVDDEASKADILLDDIEVTFPVLYDTNGEVSKLYDVSAMPTTVMIDRSGAQRLVHLGYRSGDEKKYEKALKLLIRE